MKLFVALGSINMLLSVALGAFGAHGLKSKISSEMLSVYQTGVHYHVIHALGLIFIGILSEKLAGTSLAGWAGWLMFAGIVLFSGSLYALSTSGVKALGAITPLGGVAFIVSWLLLAIAAWKSL
ncbi:DUF423 domain-containing protein [Ferviditalea candida]|uniref:DUF423 domain-containing protein n=1 Tax=Ferviditalea candida TaxID=3108399 RepID=A0ABU5ZJR5_9BACL|nr:DUF423 domain-containing protein [Paenibacillaceae bacterium T2]